jgi:type II secretory pathway component PulJ
MNVMALTVCIALSVTTIQIFSQTTKSERAASEKERARIALESKVELLTRQNVDAQERIESANRTLTLLQRRKTDAEKSLAQAEANRDEATGGTVGRFFSGKDNKDLSIKLQLAQTELDKVNQMIEKENTWRSQIQSNQNEVSRILKSSSADLEKQNQTYAALFDSLKMDSSFLEFKNKVGSTERALDLIKNKLDQSIMGAYLQDKMGGFVNSKLMCQGVERCTKNPTALISNKDIQNSFTGRAASTRSDDVSNKRKTTGAQESTVGVGQ